MVEVLIGGIADAVGAALNAIVEMLLPLISFNFEAFIVTFPFAVNSYPIIQRAAMGAIMLLAAITMIAHIMPGSRITITPVRAIANVAIAVIVVYYGNYILMAIMELMQAPYDALLSTGADNGVFYVDFAGITSLLADAFALQSVLLYLLILILIGIAFLKLMLEAVERYAILFVLVFLSPLFASTLATQQTNGVFKRYFSMFISQCILLVLNVWSLKMAVSMFESLNGSPYKILSLLLGYAILRIAAKFDNYLNQIGLNAAITGAGIGGELLTSGMALASMLNGGQGKSASGSGSASGVLGGGGGIVGGAAAAAQKVSPLGFAGSFTRNMGKQVFSGENVGFGAKAKAAWAEAKGENLWTNIFSRADNATFTAASHGHALTEDQLASVSGNGILAGNIQDSFAEGGGTTDSMVIGATMQGLNLDAVDPSMKECVNTLYGNNPNAQDVVAHADQNGMCASYTQGGIQHDFTVLNKQQYCALTQQEREAYTPVKSASGRISYYRHDSARLPSEAQQQKEAAAESIQRFTQDPASSSISAAEYSQISRNRDGVAGAAAVYAGFQEHHTSYEYDAAHSTEGANHFQTMFQSSTLSKSMVSQAVMAADGGENLEYAKSSEFGSVMRWTNEQGKTCQIARLNEAGLRANGIPDIAAAENQGWKRVNLNGSIFYENSFIEKDADSAAEYKHFTA